MVRYNLIATALVAAACVLPLAFASPHNLTSNTQDTKHHAKLQYPHPHHHHQISTDDTENHGHVARDASAVALPTVRRYPNEDARIRAQDYTGRDDNMRITTYNAGNTDMSLWIEINYSAQGFRFDVADPDRSWAHKIKLRPGESVEMGNFAEPGWRLPEGSKFSGSVRALRGCSDGGDWCMDAANAATKIEFAADPYGHRNNIGINLSLVDGFNTRAELAFGEGSDCPAFSCAPSDWDVRAKCPPTHLKDNGGHLQCLSDCKVTDSWNDCSSNNPSSHHLKALCPAAYAWSGDHEGTYADCNPKGDVLIVVS